MPSVDTKKRLIVPIPFDPDDVWGAKPKHHVTGSVDGTWVRAPIERVDGGFRIVLGPTWLRDHPIAADGKTKVKAEFAPEGPQRDDLAPDIAAALSAEPEAGAFFDSLAQFYRKGYLSWIDATKRRPDERARRIAEVVDLCKRQIKQRPRG